MRRRDFLGTLGTAAAWPLAARAERAAMPVVGFLHSAGSDYVKHFAPAVREGLKDTGYVEGENVAIEYRAANGQYDRLTGLATDLIDRKVSVILAAGGNEPAKVAKAARATIPIVFVTAGDPIAGGLVTSLSRPGGNVTGVSVLGASLEGKRLGLLHQLVPGETPIAALINPKYPDADRQERELQDAAGILGRQIEIWHAASDAEVEAGFASAAQKKAGALLVAQDPYFASRRDQLVALAARYRLPAIYFLREFADFGGLISYGPDFGAGYRQAGNYVGRILKSANPADLPVVQSSKFELVINMKTARALGLTPPTVLLAGADELIE